LRIRQSPVEPRADLEFCAPAPRSALANAPTPELCAAQCRCPLSHPTRRAAASSQRVGEGRGEGVLLAPESVPEKFSHSSPREACHYPQVWDAIEGNPKGIVSSSPGLRACELPWDIVQTASLPQRGCGRARHPRAQPRWGWFVLTRWTQGSSPALSENPSPLIQPKCSQCATVVLIPLPRKSGVATLDFVAESLRDSHDSSPERWVMMSREERDGERRPFSHTHLPFLADFQTRSHTRPSTLHLR